MKLRLHAFAIMTVAAAALIGCDKNSGASSSSGAAATSIVTLQTATSTLAPGASTTVTVTGGSGTYTSAYASQGTIYQQSNNIYVYTAPSSPTASTTTFTIYDSAGAVGTGYILISGGGSNTTSASSCGGSYSATIGGISATLFVVQGSGGYIGGYLYMSNYYYPVIGSCSFTGGSGSISFTNIVDSATYSGSVALSGTQLAISGTMTSSGGSTFSWNATSQTPAATFTEPTYSCQGNYDATVATNTGTITLVQDGGGNVAGYLYLQGYVYALTGTCNANGGSVSLTNRTTGSLYTGTTVYNGSTVNMSGSFTTTSGSTYTWSAIEK